MTADTFAATRGRPVAALIGAGVFTGDDFPSDWPADATLTLDCDPGDRGTHVIEWVVTLDTPTSDTHPHSLNGVRDSIFRALLDYPYSIEPDIASTLRAALRGGHEQGPDNGRITPETRVTLWMAVDSGSVMTVAELLDGVCSPFAEAMTRFADPDSRSYLFGDR